MPTAGPSVAGVDADLLAAIILGAVFMGAMTYIGNGPNFMVKAIAEKHNVRMPSFFGYMLYSCAVLLPISIAMNWLFLRQRRNSSSAGARRHACRRSRRGQHRSGGLLSPRRHQTQTKCQFRGTRTSQDFSHLPQLSGPSQPGPSAARLAMSLREELSGRKAGFSPGRSLTLS